MTSDAIAIVGRGCVLPGALDPVTFWTNIVSGRCTLSPVPDDHWSLPRDQMLGRGDDRALTDVAGVVAWSKPYTLDPVFDWTLHAARAALLDAGRDGPQPRAGLIMGNLSYPTRGVLHYAEQVWSRGAMTVDPRNRFCSGYPVLLAARELGLGGDAFALDAACASALYAVKLGCDRLQEGIADLMVVGGVNAADMLFLHMGFSALGALSPTGLSRPFHRGADGLIPGEGAACFAMMRLSDAVAERIPVHGVIRGVGLTNDGRTGGFLNPARAAQVDAMRLAYSRSGLEPHTVSLVECHAAGTPGGDATEVASMAEVFAGNTDLPVGSVKSNVGHLLTAAGAVGLLKVLGALAAGVRPATLGATEPRDGFAGTPLRPLQDNEHWPGQRRAAVSAFGFGGCNAHLIVEAYEPGATAIAVSKPAPRAPSAPIEVAVVAVQGTVGRLDLETALLAGQVDHHASSVVHVSVNGLRSPPADLPEMLAQHSLLLQVARDAVADVALPKERTIVLVGMGCDPEGARYHLRWQGHQDVVPKLSAARVIGLMPNIVASRITAQLDLTGPSFTVSAEEASGSVALRLAAGMLRTGEADAAIVGAVDLSHEPVHQSALLGLGIDRPPGDAAVVVVLKRLGDARRDGDTVLAFVDDEGDAAEDAADRESDLIVGAAIGAAVDPTDWFGSPHAAHGLLAVATAVVALHHRVVPQRGAPAEKRATLRFAEVVVSALDAQPARICLTAGDETPLARRTPPSGAYLELPAHPVPVADLMKSSLRSRPATDRRDAETMMRAPELASVAANATGTEAAAPENTADVGGSGRSRAFVDGQERVADLHRAFLVRQTEAHRHYLQLNAQMVSALSSGRQFPRHEAPVRPPEAAEAPSRPLFDRDDLLVHARGLISELFGPEFAAQDVYPRQTRLPEPPLLLVHRVITLDAVAASMGTGTIHTQTDVALNEWYLDACGRMTAGMLVEAGQADLLLISWLGVDLINRGERVYRLLGCEVTFHGELPRPGDTLDYTIGVDSHYEHNEVRLFNFHSNCMVAGETRLTVQNGQAGFFSDPELAAGGGVIWDPDAESVRDDGPVDPPVFCHGKDRFDEASLEAFVGGRPAECFGDQWRATRAHVRTPRTGSGRLRLLDEITEFNPVGGPWGRGYLCARTAVAPDDWFFAGHFRHDPCMPGTLMLEACVQAMEFYLAAMGCTVERDGWRFEPVSDQPYVLRCRGQVIPTSKLLTYEVFVSGFSAGPRPTLYADVLCTVDGVKAFHARRLGVHLVPDVPLDHWRALGRPSVQRTGDLVPLPSLGGLVECPEDPMAAATNGFPFDYRAMLGWAWGWRADGGGPRLAQWDKARRFPRLPGPPYLFVTRISHLDGAQGHLREGAWLTAEYDVPLEAWFFDEAASAAMPLAALVEVVLQPCGALSMYVGSISESDPDLFYRNLDGEFEITGHVQSGVRTLSTRVQLHSTARFASSVIQSFDIECRADGRQIMTGTASFGFFAQAALSEQVGIPPAENERAALNAPSEVRVELRERPARYFGGSLRMPGPMLLMLDRISGFWPHGGKAGHGRVRAELDIDPDSWYFKAHFFGDPVQPGSLGLDAVCQMLQFFCIQTGVGASVPNPTFGLIILGRAKWQFRGQVLTNDERVTIEADILEVGDDFVRAEAWLWLDGRRIYHVAELGMRVVSGQDTTPAIVDQVIDPSVATWIGDHRPNWTVPALPMMTTVDLIAGAAGQLTGRRVVQLTDVQLKRWLPVSGAIRLRTRAQRAGDTVAVSLLVWREAGRLSRYEPAATATVHVGAPPLPPPPFASLIDAELSPDIYDSAAMFHGPAFHYLNELRIGSTGSTAILDAAAGTVPRGHLHQGLLDGVTHAVPHTSLWHWLGAEARDHAGAPVRIPTLSLFETLPDSGELRVEARFAGYDGDNRHRPAFDLQAYRDGRMVLALRLVDRLWPLDQLAGVPLPLLRSFLRDHDYVEELCPGRYDGATTRFSLSADHWPVVAILPGTPESVFGLPEGAHLVDHIERMAVVAHLAHTLKVHPRRFVLAPDLRSGWVEGRPEEVHHVSVTESGGEFTVANASPPPGGSSP